MKSFKSPALLAALLAVAFLPAEAKPVNVAVCNLSACLTTAIGPRISKPSWRSAAAR